MYGKSVVISLSVDGQGAAFNILVDMDVTPATGAAQVSLFSQFDGTAVLECDSRVDPVGMVTIITVAAIGHDKSQLKGVFRKIHGHVCGITGCKVGNGTTAVKHVLGIDECRTAGIEQGYEFVAVGRIIGSPDNAVVIAVELAVVGRVVVHVEHVGICQQLVGRLVVLGQIASEHQR